MTAKIDEILAKMPWSRRSGPGKWMCKCPAHEDRSASLSIASNDGQTLIHCFAGCTPEEIMGAIGMTMADLWESVEPSMHYDPPKTGAIPRTSVAYLFPILITEAQIIAQATRELMAGHTLSVRDEARVLIARWAIEDAGAAYRGR